MPTVAKSATWCFPLRAGPAGVGPEPEEVRERVFAASVMTGQGAGIEHRLAGSAQPLPDLWPWLTSLRGENKRRVERQTHPEPPETPETWPEVG